MDTDCFILGVITKDFIKDIKNFEDLFDFGSLYENHEIVSIKVKKNLN